MWLMRQPASDFVNNMVSIERLLIALFRNVPATFSVLVTQANVPEPPLVLLSNVRVTALLNSASA
jgi:hypothetical protein